MYLGHGIIWVTDDIHTVMHVLPSLLLRHLHAMCDPMMRIPPGVVDQPFHFCPLRLLHTKAAFPPVAHLPQGAASGRPQLEGGGGAGASGAATGALPSISSTTTQAASRGSTGGAQAGRGRGSGGGAGAKATALTRVVAKYHKHEEMLPEDPLQVIGHWTALLLE
jgi:hypothetical protein